MYQNSFSLPTPFSTQRQEEQVSFILVSNSILKIVFTGFLLAFSVLGIIICFNTTLSPTLAQSQMLPKEFLSGVYEETTTQ